MTFDRLWERQKAHVKLMLISLTRDIDLADDLIQETYLQARDGFAGFQEGDAWAWLSAIARKCFFTHKSKASDNLQSTLKDDISAREESLRNTFNQLPATLRTSLLLKHLKHSTYDEAAQLLSWPVSTVRQRVWEAAGYLVSINEINPDGCIEHKCQILPGYDLVDYIYGIPIQNLIDINSHLKDCPDCLNYSEQMRKSFSLLRLIEDEYTLTQVIDIDQNGLPTFYTWSSVINPFGEPVDTWWWFIDEDQKVDHASVNGIDLPFVLVQDIENQSKYETALPETIRPGEPVNCLIISHPATPDHIAERVSGNWWRYRFYTTPGSEYQWALSMKVRLPAGAKLISSDPEPTAVVTRSATTLSWKTVTPILDWKPGMELPWRFDCTIEYLL